MTDATQKDLEQDAAEKRLSAKLDALATGIAGIVAAMTELQERLREEIREVKDHVTGLDERLETLRPIEVAINKLHSVLQR